MSGKWLFLFSSTVNILNNQYREWKVIEKFRKNDSRLFAVCWNLPNFIRRFNSYSIIIDHDEWRMQNSVKIDFQFRWKALETPTIVQIFTLKHWLITRLFNVLLETVTIQICIFVRMIFNRRKVEKFQRNIQFDCCGFKTLKSTHTNPQFYWRLKIEWLIKRTKGKGNNQIRETWNNVKIRYSIVCINIKR